MLGQAFLRFAVILRILGKLQEFPPRTRLVVALHRCPERSEHRDDSDAWRLCRVSCPAFVFSSGSVFVRYLQRENRKMNMDPYFLKAKMRNMFLYLQVDSLFEVFASIVSPQDWFRVLKIVSSPSSGVLNNHKGEILPFCSETKIDISVCVPSLTRAHNPPICKPSNFGEEQQQQVRNSNLHKKYPIFSKTLAVDKSF